MLPVLTHTIGDDRDLDFTVADSSGTAENITGWAFWFTVKSAAADADAASLFQLTSEADEIVVDVPASGIGRILVRAVHTKGKDAGKYQYDFQCRKGAVGSKIETLSRGIFTLTDEITLAE